MAAIDGADAVVNLAGEGIADKRWTAARKSAILASRIDATRAIVAAIRAARTPPGVLISSSAIGIYGTRGDEPLTEDTPPGSDFLADVCRAWEAEAATAAPITRIVFVRTGLVLARTGGALPKMALPFRFFGGGPMGSGRQYMSWIHLADWIAMVRWAVATAASVRSTESHSADTGDQRRVRAHARLRHAASGIHPRTGVRDAARSR